MAGDYDHWKTTNPDDRFLGPKPEPRIVTSYEFPPIPDRRFDWVAYRDGDEEGLCGRGPTEADAIAELLMMEESEL